MTRSRVLRILGVVVVVALVVAAVAVSYRAGYGRGMVEGAGVEFPFLGERSDFGPDARGGHPGFDGEGFEGRGPGHFGGDYDGRGFDGDFDGFGRRSFGFAGVFFLAIPIIGMLLQGIFIGVVVAVTLNWIQRRQARVPADEEEPPAQDEPKTKSKRSTKESE
ncbi:MAG: hypothetical protein DWQ07_25390 [Chloroflexi bacterium]|nr:MAG: hypothetical protein DWQ07_25390 [Chloroflexota bacterium]MBL1196129.1 hypothetical protein [Chloroflexota bacterium]NOH13422.1 hypothetical protein [Chloroflexota bacterium]